MNYICKILKIVVHCENNQILFQSKIPRIVLLVNLEWYDFEGFFEFDVAQIFRYSLIIVLLLSLFVYSPSANKARVKEAHKRIMILNHPDKGKCLERAESVLTLKHTVQSHRRDMSHRAESIKHFKKEICCIRHIKKDMSCILGAESIKHIKKKVSKLKLRV